MKQFLTICSVCLLFIWACSPSTTEVVQAEPKPTPKPMPKKERLTDCITLDDLDPGLKSATEDAFTLYRDQIRFRNFPEAKDLWKQAFYTAPGANGRATYHFDDGIKIYDYLYKNMEDESKKGGLVDTILSIYNKRMSCFEDDGTILARKAFNSYYSYRDYVNHDEIFNWFDEVVQLKGLESDYFVVNPYSKMLYDRVLEEKIDHASASTKALQIFDIIANGMETCEEKYCEAWDVIDQYAPPLLSNLEGIKGFYPCDYFMTKYYSQYEENPTDCDNVTEVYLKMVWAECDPEDDRVITLKEAKEKECYVPPPPPGPCKEAYALLNAGQFKEAIAKFDECAASKSDPHKQADMLLINSKIYYAHIKNFPAARKYARNAAALKDNWGEPYMLIGKLYASSGPLCGPGTGWDSQVVTWAAIDKFSYAKQIDPSVTEEANKWIARYRKYMPKKEDIFFRQVKAGDRFVVPCWIQESTTIRTSD